MGINKFIGREPIFFASNSNGDYEILRWVTGGRQHGFAMSVHRTDADREWPYDRESSIGKLNAVLNEAERHNWLMVDMKADWRTIKVSRSSGLEGSSP